MSNSLNQKATCLCGAVKITVAEVNPKFSVCHCQTCLSWGGSPFFAVHCGTQVQIDNPAKIKEFDSSLWAARGFCIDCGTHLYYRLKKSGAYNMPVGLFPDLPDLTMVMQYFSDQRPDYYCFSNQTKEMTSAQITAYFADKI